MDAVAPHQGDLVLVKTRHSFFAYTELEPQLRNLGVHRLVVAGVTPNIGPARHSGPEALRGPQLIAEAPRVVPTGVRVISSGPLPRYMRLSYFRAFGSPSDAATGELACSCICTSTAATIFLSDRRPKAVRR
ncbi:isochorismatase family protein [Nocardia sp. NPDC060256]|uniref:isochorismatase family protein n=1 Tax=unclassified Nocardia TaxID=2637762 RepID=UPI00364FF191